MVLDREARQAYYLFVLSTAVVEDLLAKHGIIVSRKTVRLWVNRGYSMSIAALIVDAISVGSVGLII